MFKAHKASADAGAAFHLLRVSPGDRADPPEEAPAGAGGGLLKDASLPHGNALMQGYGGHGSELVSAAFSADGRTLVTAGASDGTMLHWRLVSADPDPALAD